MIVGLGNPGRKYARTRHNAGFRLAEILAGEGKWRNFKDLGRYAENEGLLIAEPLTYMNESGRLVAPLSRSRGLKPQEILVCFDDWALPLGKIRLRQGGSGGGHKGMESVIDSLGAADVPRLRLGIGPKPDAVEAVDFVLSPFSSSEGALLDESLERAAEAVRLAASEGLEASMTRFN